MKEQVRYNEKWMPKKQERGEVIKQGVRVRRSRQDVRRSGQARERSESKEEQQVMCKSKGGVSNIGVGSGKQGVRVSNTEPVRY